MSKKDERTTNPDATRAIMGGRIDYLSISGDDWFNIFVSESGYKKIKNSSLLISKSWLKKMNFFVSKV